MSGKNKKQFARYMENGSFLETPTMRGIEFTQTRRTTEGNGVRLPGNQRTPQRTGRPLKKARRRKDSRDVPIPFSEETHSPKL